MFQLKKVRGFCSAVLGALSFAALTAMSAASADSGGWIVHGYYENDTHYRSADAAGDTVGLSKFRNTVQMTMKKRLFDGWSFGGTLRGTYDGVYQFNSSEFGRNAGGPILLQNTAAPAFAGSPFTNLAQSFVPQGGGIDQSEATALGLPPTNAFGFNSTNPNAAHFNPNQGMLVLGQRWHSTATGGVEFGVPVRPCNVGELEFPEFNSRLDVIREAYFTRKIGLSNTQDIFLKVGRQQVIWGRTDLFRVLDVINPVDYSRNNIYDELEDIRIPMLMVQGEYRMGASNWLQEQNLQLVWNVEKFRPDNLGQCGTPNVILDAGCFFRGMKNLWDNGGTVANFASVPPGKPGMFAATDFGINQIGIRNVHLPAWTLGNTQIGVKFEGVSADGSVSFSLNALSYRSQLPSLHAFNNGAVNPFTGASGNTTPPAAGVPVGYLIAFDMDYPRVNLIGGSLDYQWEWAKTAVRFEGAYTTGEEFANSLRPELFSRNPVLRTVIGLDRPTFIPFVSGHSATLISGQVFFQHLFKFERNYEPLGPVGMADWENNAITTLLVKGFYLNNRLSPQVIFARDFMARADVISPSIEWIFNDHLKASVGGNFKDNDIRRYNFDDCRSCNPYPPFTTYTGASPAQPFVPGSYGLAGIEPLGRFRAGPLGAAAIGRAEERRIELLKAAGFNSMDEIRWLDAPQVEALLRAETLLHDLGAVDREGVITPLGRRMLSFPAHPRYARMLLAAQEFGCVRAASLMAALTQSRPLLMRTDRRTEEERKDLFGGGGSDFLVMARAFRWAEKNDFRADRCRQLAVHADAARQTGRVFEQFLKLAEEQRLDVDAPAAPDEALAKCILAGFADQVARRRGSGTNLCDIVHGRRGLLAKESAAAESRLLVAAEISEIGQGNGDARVQLSMATAIDEQMLRELFPDDFTDRDDFFFDTSTNRVVRRSEKMFRDLVLESVHREAQACDETSKVLALALAEGDLPLPTWKEEAEEWIQRVHWLKHHHPELDLPSFDDSGRLQALEKWCSGAVGYREVKDRPALPSLQSLLTPLQRSSLERLAPGHHELPGGRKARGGSHSLVAGRNAGGGRDSTPPQ